MKIEQDKATDLTKEFSNFAQRAFQYISTLYDVELSTIPKFWEYKTIHCSERQLLLVSYYNTDIQEKRIIPVDLQKYMVHILENYEQLPFRPIVEDIENLIKNDKKHIYENIKEEEVERV